MGIPEAQLDTWSHQGSITQSGSTYRTIQATLEAAGAPYAGRSHQVFLQGSYGNDTNIFAESDVDVVIQLDECFHHDNLSNLSEQDRVAFRAAFANATYSHADFKRDVVSVLRASYGSDVIVGTKAINIKANGGRRSADVITALQFRRYYRFGGMRDESHEDGMCFFDSSNNLVVNYPRQHAKNMAAKHQMTGGWLKPMVRVLKNLRGKLIEEGLITQGTAPSYYLEGLLYNVPADRFGGSYSASLKNSLDWIRATDRSDFVCANNQYFLLREGSLITWRASDCDVFLTAADTLWNQW